MPDYHIYIHSNQASSIANNTQPKEESMDGAFSVKQAFNVAQQFATSGFTSAVNTGISALTKAAPYVAIAVASVKVADRVLTTGFQHQEEYTGYYQNNLAYNNFKTGISATLNPVKTLTNYLHVNAQNNKANMQREQQRTLVGNTLFNDGKLGV